MPHVAVGRNEDVESAFGGRDRVAVQQARPAELVGGLDFIAGKVLLERNGSALIE
jgi:hypothetical protein